MPRLAEIERLRAEIAQIEKRPALSGSPDTGDVVEGSKVLTAPAGLLHEIFADDPRIAGSSLGFALGLSRGLLGKARQAIVYLQLTNESQEVGFPYGVGIASFGIDPDTVVFCRTVTIVELLWAIEEAVVCRAVAAVIADIGSHQRALDFTASRRLSLHAAAAGTSILLLRYGRHREASAARLRWRINPALSGEQLFDIRAPGPPRFHVEIEKGRFGTRTKPLDGLNLLLDWTENGFVTVEPGKRLPVSRPASLSHTQSATLGNRLSKAG